MSQTIRFGSVCSGIEAASVAWGPIGWQAAWFAEIEPFPSAVLAHHYPDVGNLGDMTRIARMVRFGEVEAPDVLCGGTPCQAFSVAGLRRSLEDERGNLTLKFVELADAVDHVRSSRGKAECIVFWENVPGVLSTKDNAFGCFLAGLAGEDEPLQPPGGKWRNAGAVYGPKRAVAWRTLDAQYFGLAQRRRRVFVVASAREGFDPAAVLFEWDGVRRDSAPSREAGKVAPTIPARSLGGGGLGTDFDIDGGVVQVCPTLRAGGNRTGGDRPPGTDVDTADSLIVTTHTLRGEGFDASEDGTGRGTPLVPVVQPYTLAIRGRGDSHNLEYRQDGTANALLTPNGGRGGVGVGAIAFHPTQDPISSEDGTTHCMGAGSSQGNATIAVAFQPGNLARGCGASPSIDVFPTLKADHGRGQSDQDPHVMHAMQVRRLTPVECERLQGFPDGYTAIPWRGRPAAQCPDGPRYKALGNSWPVNVVRWIGLRIHRSLRTDQ